MPLLRPEVPAKKKAAIHAKVKRSKFAVRRHGRTWLSRSMTCLTLQQGDVSHCLAWCRQPDAGAGDKDVKPRPPPHAAPAPPVKPRPPPHPQTAAFRAIPPRQGWVRLHDGANNLTQGWPGATQTTPARRASAPSETQTTPASTNCRISSHSAQAGAGPVTSRGKQPQAGVALVTPRRKQPDTGAGPVKPRPPLHPQIAAFRTIPPRQGWARLHDGANNQTQGRPSDTQTTPAPRASAPSETQTTPASTNCCISSHSAEAGAGPVTSRGKQPQAGVVPVTR